MKKTSMPLDRPDARRRLVLQGAAAALLGGVGLAGCGGGGPAGVTAVAADADPREQPLRGVGGGGTGAPMRSFVSAVVDSTLPLTVNGVRFDTDGSRITDADGNPLDALSILPGMTARIEADAIRERGVAPHALALAIVLGEQLLGPVSSVDGLTSSFIALGQRVVLTSRTLLDPALATGLAGLQVGSVVQVWGQLDPAGQRIVASRVDLKPSASTFAVRGVLSRLDRVNGRVAIGGLEAAFAADDASVVAAEVHVGDVVRGRCTSAADGSGQVLLALRGDALQLPDHVAAEIEGRVTRIDSAQRFAVDGVEVDASAATALHGVAALALGARVEVHGRSSHGVLLAKAVTVEADEPVELEGTISAADGAKQRFVVRGVTVVWSGATAFTGGSAALLTRQRRVAVRGRWNADRSRLQALRIHIEA